MTWTAPDVARTHPRRAADERTAMDTALDYQRNTLLHNCAGLTAEQLCERSAPPSSLSLLGLVRHMALVERWWFRVNATGADLELPYTSDQNPDGEFDDATAASAEADLPLDHTFTSRRGETMDLRWTYLHMIEEYARHNGHADLLRERIDGTTGA